MEQILEEFWLKNQEQFVPEATWEERSSYWEDKFSHGLAALGKIITSIEFFFNADHCDNFGVFVSVFCELCTV